MERSNQGKLTKRQLHQRYAKYLVSIVAIFTTANQDDDARAGPQISCEVHKQKFADYRLPKCKNYIPWVLGHISADILRGLRLHNAGKTKLSEIGRVLSVPAVKPKHPPY